MKRILGAVVLFILLTLTIVALNRVDTPKASAGTTTDTTVNVPRSH